MRPGPWWRRIAKGDRGHLTLVVGTFVISRAVFIADGLAFRADPPGQIHLLDLDQLAADPFLAFTDLHIQPPLFNFFVGAVLRWSPFPAGISFQVLYLAAGLVTVLCLWSLLRNLGARRWVATAATILVVVDPLLIRDESSLTYETLVAALLVGTAWAVDRYFRRPDGSRFVVVLALLVVGVLTRTTLHPVWLVGALAIVLIVRRPRMPALRAGAAVAVALACVAVPMVHNLVRFDTFGFSSYAGMNLERITVMQLPQERLDELIDQERVSPAAAVAPYRPYSDYARFYPRCDPDTGVAVLDDFIKSSNGAPNLNNICYLPVYRQALRDSVAAIRNEPANYARAVGVAATLYASWGTHFNDPDSSLWHDWERIYAPVMLPVDAHYDFGHGDPQASTAAIGAMTQLLDVSLVIVLALILVVVQGVLAAADLLRGRGDATTWTRVFIGFMVVAITAASVSVDTFENARFREPLDPLLLGITAAVLCEAAARFVARVRGRRSEGHAEGGAPAR